MKKHLLASTVACVGGALAATLPLSAHAGAELSAGTWWVYQYAGSNDVDKETGGKFADPAFILYADDDGSHGRWHFSSELRIGTGSFTDAPNNNSGDNFAMHKAWIGYDVNDDTSLKLGKSQVPFGWKTVNFWPGDGLQGGYGDQMDVGLKLSSDVDDFHYDVAYYHQDDWGGTSTDTLDDGKHWGGSKNGDTTFRKIKTGVVNGDWNYMPGHTVGVSYQYGRLQDLTQISNTPPRTNDNGKHQAIDLHYYFEQGDFYAKYRFIGAERDFSGMDAFLASPYAPVDEKVKTRRHTATVGYNHNDWSYYLDSGVAKSKTDGNEGQNGKFFAPGMRYQYGPGWIYLEYLWQDADVNRNGDIQEADFKALYAAFDFYF